MQVSETDCRTHSRQGRTTQAIECFEQLSRGNGIQADVATYEVARLSATSGTDPLQVLSLLDRYQQRFPEGVMRGEVDWLRVQSLYRSGRHRAALSESDALLSTSAGRVLAAEVHWLRGIIFEERLLDFGRAASEFVTFVGMPGARGDEGEWRRARCLERLGRRTEATEAYRRYLERGDARRAAEVRSKLEELADTRRSPLSN
ncbi:MAG TPA: hypothetical protein VFQ61_05355 [Polyangiaceae bacterium]|nr:hypothetical protein [Polyangiaceae bacterium]